MMHPHNLYHLTLRICISRGVRHTSQRSATSPSPFIIIFLEFFFLKSNPPSILPFPPPPKKKKFPTLRTHCDFSSQAQPFALIYALPFRFSSMFDGYAVFYLVMFILSLSPRVGTGDDQRGDEIMKKKKKERGKKKDTSLTFRWKRNRMERNNGDRDDRLFRRFFHHRLVIVTAANNFVARSSSQRWAILLRLSHYFFFLSPLPPNFSFIFVSGSMPYHVFEMPEIENG